MAEQGASSDPICVTLSKASSLGLIFFIRKKRDLIQLPSGSCHSGHSPSCSLTLSIILQIVQTALLYFFSFSRRNGGIKTGYFAQGMTFLLEGELDWSLASGKPFCH